MAMWRANAAMRVIDPRRAASFEAGQSVRFARCPTAAVLDDG
jgi:hypothetical protein